MEFAPQLPLDPYEIAVAKTRNYLRAAATPALHLGCGGHRFPGWLNLDRHEAAEIYCDFTQPLAFLPARSFQYCYSEHVLEHFTRPQALALATTVHAVLKEGGVFRVAVPDLDFIVAEYLNYQPGRWAHFHDSFAGDYGGSFRTRGELMDICMRGWGHRYLFNEEDLRILLKRAGFKTVTRTEYRASEHPALRGIETRPPLEDTLIMEATV